MLFVPSHDPCTRSLEHNPEIYLINMISPEHMCCHQHQNMIKGMIALSVGFDTLIERTTIEPLHFWVIKTFLASLPGSEAPLVSETW